MASGSFARSSVIRTTSAASIAASEPIRPSPRRHRPAQSPRRASLMPSPTKRASLRIAPPLACCQQRQSLSCGRSSRRADVIPASFLAIAAAAEGESPGETSFYPSRLESAYRLSRGGFKGIGNPADCQGTSRFSPHRQGCRQTMTAAPSQFHAAASGLALPASKTVPSVNEPRRNPAFFPAFRQSGCPSPADRYRKMDFAIAWERLSAKMAAASQQIRFRNARRRAQCP